MDNADIEIAKEIKESKENHKKKLKDAIERIGDLEYRVDQLENSLEAHKHDGDGFPTTNY